MFGYRKQSSINDAIGRRGGFPTRLVSRRPISKPGDRAAMPVLSVSSDSLVSSEQGRLETCPYVALGANSALPGKGSAIG